MKKIMIRIAVAVLCLTVLPVSAFAAQTLIPVGQVVGLELQDGTVRVAAYDERMGENAREAGIVPGDIIEKVDNITIRSYEDLRHALRRSDGTVSLTVNRNGKQKVLQLTPEITKDGPKLGLYLRQGVTGIGTVTYYDPATGEFATLGHGVNNSRGKLVEMTEGSAFDAKVVAVKKGKSGAPGQLTGSIERLEPTGELTGNTPQGVFGKTDQPWTGETMEIGTASQVKTGKATIRSTVSGEEVREYSVEILKIYPKSRQTGRNLLIRVTDPALLEITGGIVQGMSGSPIIQDGKLIGAVTHVLVNDPTTGYGIFIENMLEAAA